LCQVIELFLELFLRALRVELDQQRLALAGEVQAAGVQRMTTA
jgi:hypothetical protein